VDGKNVIGVALATGSSKVRRMMATNLEVASRTVVRAQKEAKEAAEAKAKAAEAKAKTKAAAAAPAAPAPKLQ
jgi:hypothetical protein